MGYAVVFVLLLGYWIFDDFWWLLWMPLVGVGAFIFWGALVSQMAQAENQRTCPVCRNWAKSVVMTDFVVGDAEIMCNEHHARRKRIWEMELALYLPLSGVNENTRKTKELKWK